MTIDITFRHVDRQIDYDLSVALNADGGIDDVWVEGGIAWLAGRGMRLNLGELSRHDEWAMGNELMQHHADEIADQVRQAIEKEREDAAYDMAEKHR